MIAKLKISAHIIEYDNLGNPNYGQLTIMWLQTLFPDSDSKDSTVRILLRLHCAHDALFDEKRAELLPVYGAIPVAVVLLEGRRRAAGLKAVVREHLPDGLEV